MSTNNFFNGGKSAPENKPTFPQSCNLLSHYFREKGSKACLGDLNHLGFMNGKLESSERPETSADTTATTMDQLLKGDADKSGQISTNLFPQNMSAYTISVQDAINNISSLSTGVGEQAAMEPKTAQMTIFYAGQVLVFDDFSAAKAKEVMLLASKGATTTVFDSITTNINKIVDNCGNNMPSSSCNLSTKLVDNFGNNMPSSSCNLSNSGPIRLESETRPQSQPIGSDLPIARRASLHRFLEKRKDRTTARAPYQIRNPSPESSPKEQFDLNL